MLVVMMLPASITTITNPHRHAASSSNNVKLHTKILDMERIVTKTTATYVSCKNDQVTTTTTKILPDDFLPGNFDVVCSQGRKAKTHAGNIYFQSIIENSATKYANAIGKREKSVIVSEIITTIQGKCRSSTCNSGGFVKKVTTDDNDGHRWEIVENDTAREKVTQSLRDVLGAGQYRSSHVSKKRRRKESNLKMVVDFDEIVKSNQFLSTTISQLANTIETSCSSSRNNQISDDQLLQRMSQTNTNILRQLKQDQTVQRKVQRQQQQKHQTISSCYITRTLLKQKRQIVDSDSDSDKESSSLKHRSKRLKNDWSYDEKKYNLCFE
jgi:hypothetical protein